MIEELLGMETGYVLDFSNRSFQEFVLDSVGRDIYCGKYDYRSGSKANLLRRFFEVEPNHVVGKLLNDLIEFARVKNNYEGNSSLINSCQEIAERLQQDPPFESLEEISEESSEKEFETLVKSIKHYIDSNQPEVGLDRLHTLSMKYLRLICKRRGISVYKDKPLHSLFGEYIKEVKKEKGFETKMTERILKSSIGNLDAFNSVRNNHSLAHDNPMLNYEESVLIFNNMVNLIRFLQTLEQKQKEEDEIDEDWGDLPF